MPALSDSDLAKLDLANSTLAISGLVDLTAPAVFDKERRADARLIVETLATSGVTTTVAAAEAAWAAFSAEVGQEWLGLPLDDDRIHIDAEAVLMACADHLGSTVLDLA